LQPRLPGEAQGREEIVRQSDIAAAIERDLLRSDGQPSIDIAKCFSCGYSMTYRGSRFCSDRCREWFDAGNPSFEEQRSRVVYRWRDGRSMQASRNGFYITCAGCQKEFESLRLRCCSVQCERAYIDRQANLAVMAEVGDVPKAKRRCVACDAVILTWRNGRRVRGDVRFCSSKCARKGPISQNRVSEGIT
jgi:ribosomal protein L24E